MACWLRTRFGRNATKIVAALIVATMAVAARADDLPRSPESAAARGYRFVTTTPLLPADFDQEVFDRLWTTWPKPLRERARDASPEERRKMAFDRYGLVESPEHPGRGPALGYVDGGDGRWVMNCFACHQGEVEGRVVRGAPNSRYALQTLTEDVRSVKLAIGKKLTHMDLASVAFPLGATNGTTNAVMFGVALGARRDLELNVLATPHGVDLLHHDCDAPPFWNVRRKKTLYADGFAAKGHRPLLQFVMLPVNTRERMEGWEEGARDLLAWIESLEPPAYPHAVDSERAARGRIAFERVCAKCHGTYGDGSAFPDKIVPIDEVGTDRARFDSLSREYRGFMAEGWFGRGHADDYRPDTNGYVAPPLNGVWASAPYFHNGSVPTLAEVLSPDSRPVVWKRSVIGYDRERVGLEVERMESMPAAVTRPDERRTYFDTRKFGKSAAGHSYPNQLTDDERRDVLEYLKTL
jgi:mono/diheme cytochrome c family protein